MRWISAVSLGVLTCATPAFGAKDGPDLACIDRNGNHNGKIDTEHEIQVLALHQDKTFREIDKNCDGSLSGEEVRAWKQTIRVQLAVRDIERQVNAGAAPKVESPKDEPRKPAEHLEWTQASGSGNFYLRRDFQDFHTYSNPTKAGGPQGNGAEFAITADRDAGNRSVSAKGVAFVPLIFDHTWDESQRNSAYVASVAFAPSLRFEYLSNSSSQLKKKNVEILTPGVTSEIEVGNLFNWSHFLRARASVVTNMGHTDSWQARGEWQPIEPGGHFCIGTPCPLFASPVLFHFDPVLVAEYAGALQGSDLASQPLFVEHDRALRVGPSLALKLYPNALRSDELPLWLANAEFKAGYNWYRDVLSNRHYSLLDLALTLRADQSDRFGISISYTRGNVEDTADHVDVGKIGVAVKF
jgi:hypothetical protein